MERTTLTAMIVEDNADFREVLAAILTVEFPTLRILQAPDAEQALAKVEKHSPDLVFVDIGLPGMNGLDFARELRRKSSDVVIIILTSYDTPEYRAAAAKRNVDHFLLKGASTHLEVTTLVRSILADRPAR